MRKSIAIPLSIASALAFTACGNGHKGQGKAKVALAKATGDKGLQKKNVTEFQREIQKKSQELDGLGFHGMNDKVTAAGVWRAATGVPPQNIEKIKQLLGEIKDSAEGMILAGKDLKSYQGEQAKARGEELKSRAVQGIEKMNAQERYDQEAAGRSKYD